MTQEELQKLMEPHGSVFTTTIIKDKMTGQSKGCGFVIFRKRKDAAAAIAAIHHNQTVPGHGNPIQLSYAKGEEPENQPEAKLFVANVAKTATEAEVKDVFAGHGDIEEVYIMRDRMTGESKGCAFVKYAEYESCSAAIQELHQKYTMEGAPQAMIVKFADPPKSATGAVGAMGAGGAMFGRPMAGGARPLPPQQQQENRLFVGSLSKTAGEKEVQTLMEQYGQVEEVYLMKERGSGLSKCSAFVKFKKRQDAETAIAALNQKVTMTI